MATPALLLVDDDLNLLEVLGSAFRARGFEVLTAADGRSALDAVTDRPEI